MQNFKCKYLLYNMKGPGNSALKIDMKLFSRPLNLLVSTPTRNPRFVNLQSGGEIIVV